MVKNKRHQKRKKLTKFAKQSIVDESAWAAFFTPIMAINEAVFAKMDINDVAKARLYDESCKGITVTSMISSK